MITPGLQRRKPKPREVPPEGSWGAGPPAQRAQLQNGPCFSTCLLNDLLPQFLHLSSGTFTTLPTDPTRGLREVWGSSGC